MKRKKRENVRSNWFPRFLLAETAKVKDRNPSIRDKICEQSWTFDLDYYVSSLVSIVLRDELQHARQCGFYFISFCNLYQHREVFSRVLRKRVLYFCLNRGAKFYLFENICFNNFFAIYVLTINIKFNILKI